jgi:hypothetical protein
MCDGRSDRVISPAFEVSVIGNPDPAFDGLTCAGEPPDEHADSATITATMSGGTNFLTTTTSSYPEDEEGLGGLAARTALPPRTGIRGREMAS